MWEDEKQRRRDHGQHSQIAIPVSQGMINNMQVLYFPYSTVDFGNDTEI